MEALGAAASVLAVISLALQLGEKAQGLIDFWDSIKDTPAEVVRLKYELGILGQLLSAIAVSEPQHFPDINLMHGSLQSCANSILKLETIVGEIEAGLAQPGLQRVWTRVRRPLKEHKLQKIFAEIERAKSSLILSQIIHNRYDQVDIRNRITGLITSNISNITEIEEEPIHSSIVTGQDLDGESSSALGIVPLSRRSPLTAVLLETTRLSLDLISGSLSLEIQNKTQLKDKEGQKLAGGKRTRQKIVVKFQPRLAILFWSFELHCVRAFGQWTPRLRVYNRVGNSPIFRYCMMGDIRKVQEMFQGGEASPYDVDDDGWSTLHYAARDHHAELCRLLIQLGADANYGTKYCGTPLLLATYRTTNLSKSKMLSVLDTIRVLMLEGQSDPMNQDKYENNALMQWNTDFGIIKWILKQEAFQVDDDQQLMFKYLDNTRRLPEDEELPDYVKRHLSEGLDVNSVVVSTKPYSASKNARTFQGMSLLHHLVLKWSEPTTEAIEALIEAIRSLLIAGADISIQCETGETPLDCILQGTIKPNLDIRTVEECESQLGSWLQLLKETGHDVERYLEVEKNLHSDRTFSCKGNIISVVRFGNPPQKRIWNEYAGPADIRNGLWVDHITKADNYKVWDDVWGGLATRRARYQAREAFEKVTREELRGKGKQKEMATLNTITQATPLPHFTKESSQKDRRSLFRELNTNNNLAQQWLESFLLVIAFGEQYSWEICFYIALTIMLLSRSTILVASSATALLLVLYSTRKMRARVQRRLRHGITPMPGSNNKFKEKEVP